MASVNILGTTCLIIVKKYDEDEDFERKSYCAYVNSYTKSIVLCDMHTYNGFENESEDTIAACQRENLRHEIVHAFFFESGLKSAAGNYNGAWAENEEMVDWIALQGEKIHKAWEEAGCLG